MIWSACWTAPLMAGPPMPGWRAGGCGGGRKVFFAGFLFEFLVTAFEVRFEPLLSY